MSQTKRARTGSDDDLPSSTVGLLSLDEVNKISETLDEHRDTLLTWLSNAKDPDRKTKLRAAVNDFCKAFTDISKAYMFLLGNQTRSDKLDNICGKFEDATKVLSSITTDLTSAAPERLYSDVVQRVAATNVSRPKKAPENNVLLTRGKPIQIEKLERVAIGPCDAMKETYPSSLDTKEALLKALNPVELKMQVKRTILGPEASVIIEGHSLNTTAISMCPSFIAAGLEIKPNCKFNPRILINNVPSDVVDDDILNCIIEQNLPEATAEDFKLIYVYPVRDNKKGRSCVVELSPALRASLMRNSTVNIRWSRCRISDHVSVLQCFKCSKFGHVAKKCPNKEKCAKCAAEHLTSTCVVKDNFSCSNCSDAKFSSTNHTAYDKAKCPVLRGLIDRKIALINYGE